MTTIAEAPTSWTVTVQFSPGSYIKTRRTAQQLTLLDVAARIGTHPHVPEHDRVAWLERIEADLVPASINTIDALHSVFRFDRSVLASLAAIARGERDPIHTPRICRICACSWRSPCTQGGEACAWVEGQDLCTACDHPAASAQDAAA
jgi:transcriptional regulator with XRE-family HTH domain